MYFNKLNSMVMSSFPVGGKTTEADAADKSICASAATHYDSNSLNAALDNRSNYPKIL
jgi:hypothetical protein